MEMSDDPISELKGRRILIVGDVVADQFLSGTISRVSREAPVFILRHDETDTRPGGAANTAANIATLGGKASIVGVIGTDLEGGLLRDTLAKLGVDLSGLITVEGRTTTKVRVLAGQQYALRQQVIRIDYEAPVKDGKTADAILKAFEKAAPGADAVVISDYGYGSVSERLASTAIALSKEKKLPIIVDSRSRLGELAPGATSATPNKEEAEALLEGILTEASCSALREQMDLDALLVTLGNKGMMLVENGCEPVILPPVGSLEPVDVTGAGDTVIAAYSLALAAGLGFYEAARIANHAGGIVVMKKGTATVSADELSDSLRSSGHSLTSETGVPST